MTRRYQTDIEERADPIGTASGSERVPQSAISTASGTEHFPQSAIPNPQSAIGTASTSERVLAWIPPLMLIIVAVSQMILAKTTSLSPWKGGGFGMFATTDGMAFRNVRIFAERRDMTEELAITPSLEDPASRARLFPSDQLLGRLGRAVIDRERRHGRELNSVRLEVWCTEFSSPSLAATEKPLRTLTLYVDQPLDNP